MSCSEPPSAACRVRSNRIGTDRRAGPSRAAGNGPERCGRHERSAVMTVLVMKSGRAASCSTRIPLAGADVSMSRTPPESAAQPRCLRSHRSPALIHEVASGVRPLDGVAHSVGEAQLHHRVVGVGALARPDPERAAEAVHRRIDTEPMQRVNKARIGHRAAGAPGEYKVGARGAPRPCFGEDFERTRRQRDAVLASGLHALGGYRPGRRGELIR